MHTLVLILNLYGYVIIARAVMSWVNPNPYNPVVQFVCRITDPVLEPIRRVLPDMGGIDLSPMVVLVAIWVLNYLL